MLTTRTRLAAALVLSCCLPIIPALGQSNPSTWDDVFSRLPVLSASLRLSSSCGKALSLPDSAFLVARAWTPDSRGNPDDQMIGIGWAIASDTNDHVPIPAMLISPMNGGIVGVRVLDALCDNYEGASPPRLIVAHGDRAFVLRGNYEYAHTDSKSVRDRIRVRGYDGRIAPATLVYAPAFCRGVLVCRAAAVIARTDIEAWHAEYELRVRDARAERIRAMPWPSDAKREVIAGGISIGMTGGMVREAWGEPGRINETLTARGRSEQWVYDADPERVRYVYLHDGIVTSIHRSR